jgi:hypothetical protein
MGIESFILAFWVWEISPIFPQGISEFSTCRLVEGFSPIFPRGNFCNFPSGNFRVFYLPVGRGIFIDFFFEEISAIFPQGIFRDFSLTQSEGFLQIFPDLKFAKLIRLPCPPPLLDKP